MHRCAKRLTLVQFYSTGGELINGEGIQLYLLPTNVNVPDVSE